MESKMVCQSSISTEQKSFGLTRSDSFSLSSLRSLVVRFSGKEVLSLKLESSFFLRAAKSSLSSGGGRKAGNGLDMR